MTDKILVVDDKVDVLNAAQLILETEGYQVTSIPFETNQSTSHVDLIGM